MVLACGHNFCRDCLAQLGAEASCPQCRARVEPGSACPNRALANIVSLVKGLRLSGGAQEESSGPQLCREHQQPLQTFCSSEKRLLCAGCLEGHQGHPLRSLPEAAQEYKGLLDALLEPLRKEEQQLLEQWRAEEQSRQECQEQLATEKQKVGLALGSLGELLRERQPVWVAWLAEQEEKMEAEWVGPLAQLSGEASRLQQLIAQTERKCCQPDGEFLQDIQGTVDRCRSYVVGCVESVSPGLQDRLRTILEKNAPVRQVVDNYKASLDMILTRKKLERPLATACKPPAFAWAHSSNFPKSPGVGPAGSVFLSATKASLETTLTRKKLERPLDTACKPLAFTFAKSPGVAPAGSGFPFNSEGPRDARSLSSPKGSISVPVPLYVQGPEAPKVYVTLDSSTAHPRLSCQRTTLTLANQNQNLPDLPGRFDQELCALGCGRLNTWWCYWEVSVQEAGNAPVCGRAVWAIGVAIESVCRKGSFQLSPQEGIWAMGKSLEGETVAFSKVHEKLSLQRPLLKLRVRLNYKAEEVEFLDAENGAPLYTFRTGPFLGERAYPFFYLGQEGVTLQCEGCPSSSVWGGFGL